MKRIITLTVLLAATPLLHAQFVVTNPVSDILSQTLHIEDIAKQIEIIENQVEQINTLTKQLQQVQAYVKAFGDPEKLTSIVGADGLMTSLRQTGVGLTLDILDEDNNLLAANVASGARTSKGSRTGTARVAGVVPVLQDV